MNLINSIKLSFLFLIIFASCTNQQKTIPEAADEELAKEVKKELIRSWEAYTTYAWPHDVLLPVSGGFKDWYEESIHISPIDAYSTLKVMGLDSLALEVENYVIDSVRWDKDLFVKTFEVNIRILGGLLAMYQYTEDPAILEKTEDFGKRMLKAFDSPTGIPYYWFNLKTGEVKGSEINIAEAGSYLMEMGILSYYTGNPVYYQAAKKAVLAIDERVSEIGLVGERLNVETGEWTNRTSHICAGIDSYYEYMYKAWLLFGDEDIKQIWDRNITAINKYLIDETDTSFWYCRVDMDSGKKLRGFITLYDAFLPAILAVSGDTLKAEKLQHSWDKLWNKYGLEPSGYDYDSVKVYWSGYDLNPEIIESAYYLFVITGKDEYLNMARQYWADIKKYCKTDIAFTAIADVRTMEKKDFMQTYFLAETLKYLYLIFAEGNGEFEFDDYVFTTEAHPFYKSQFKEDEIKVSLGIE